MLETDKKNETVLPSRPEVLLNVITTADFTLIDCTVQCFTTFILVVSSQTLTHANFASTKQRTSMIFFVVVAVFTMQLHYMLLDSPFRPADITDRARIYHLPHAVKAIASENVLSLKAIMSES